MKEQVQVTKEKKINKTTIDQHRKMPKIKGPLCAKPATKKLNPRPARIAFIREKIINHFKINGQDITPFNNLNLLDVGCGGGILCEAMAQEVACKY